MRIIKSAKQADEFIKACSTCGSILGIRKGDLSCGGGENWICSCPICNSEIRIVGKINSLFPWKMEDENDTQVQGDNSVRFNSL